MTRFFKNAVSLIASLSKPGIETVIGPDATGMDLQRDDNPVDEVLDRARHGAPGRNLREPRPAASARSVVVSPMFKTVVWIVAAIVVLSACATIWLSFYAGTPQYPKVETALNLMGSAFSASVGAVLGLIGGKLA